MESSITLDYTTACFKARSSKQLSSRLSAAVCLNIRDKYGAVILYIVTARDSGFNDESNVGS